LLKNYLHQAPLSYKEKEALNETFKVKPDHQGPGDNDALDERVVSLHALVNARKQTRLKRIDQLINLEADDE